jgi:peptidoglycan/LPS O-acetylase OafA/YrhL
MPEILVDKTKNKVYTLNALRGFSAILVIFYHMIENGKYLDPDYLPGWFKYFAVKSQIRILIFFVISGAVIQLSNKKGLTLHTIKSYLKKRGIRIYPIYIVSLTIALLVSPVAYSFFTIAGNYTFLQVAFVPVVLANGPIWTLHYEILFYFLFIPISMFNIDPVKVVVAALVIGFGNVLLSKYFYFPLLTSYCFGFAFWGIGLIIVKHFSNKITEKADNTKLVSLLFLIVTVPYLNELSKDIYLLSMKYFGRELRFLYDGNINNWFSIAFSVYDFAYIPYCFFAVMLFSKRDFKFKTLLWCLLQLVPAYTLFSMYKKLGYIDIKTIIFPCVCYLISFFLLFIHSNFINKISEKVINFLIWMGGISYGMYIIHGPILVIFNRIGFVTGTPFSFALRLVLYFVFTFAAAYFLEKKFQVWVAAHLMNTKIVTA